MRRNLCQSYPGNVSLSPRRFFVNTLVFRADFDPNITFRELVRQVRSYALDAYSHQDVPYEKLLPELVPQRWINTSPLFQVMFTFQNIPKQIFEISGLEMEELDFETGIAKFDLSVEAFEDDRFHCRFEYNTDLFDMTTVLRQMSHFRNLILAGLKNPDEPIALIQLMDASEFDRTVFEWNDTGAVYSKQGRVHQVFEEQAARAPDATALIYRDQEFSYAKVNEQANQLAHFLSKKGVQSGSLVGVSLDRSPELTIALLAVLKTGASYVPLDPIYPVERLASMIADTEVICVITISQLRNKLPESQRDLVLLDREKDSLKKEPIANFASKPSTGESERLYVLYTSGSSGRPKGVEGTHRGALNRMEWMRERYPFQAGEVDCQKTNVGFVDSVCEIFGPLLSGVPSVILPQEAVLDPEVMVRTLGDNRVTRIILVPPLLRALLEHAPNLGERLPHLKLWWCGGEMLPWELAKMFRKACPRATLLNIYGSSEVAADVTWHEVKAEEEETAEMEAATSVPIGRPTSNSQVYVLDERTNPVPVGVRGEIYVGGAQLALGYWRQPELTAERFVKNRIAPEKSEKLYRTGDMGRWRVTRDVAGRETGELEYLGRLDSEVKVRGMRIELGEVETVLGRHEWVAEAVVELSGTGVEQRLIAYVVGKEGKAPSARELRRYVRTQLPEHMVPASFVKVDELPLLSSGKVNRRALSAVPGVSLAEQIVVAPRTEVEQKLAAMWAEVLKLKEVGVDQNFFELGGHSLLVLQVMSRIRREFNVELAVRTMFEQPTIAGLGVEVEKAQATGIKSRTPALRRRPRPAPNVSLEALLAQLETLPADDAETLLKRVLDAKSSDGAEAVGQEPEP